MDILLENGDITLAVEVKAKLTIPDVQEHTARMEKLRRYADEHGDPRRLMGAAAGAIIPGGMSLPGAELRGIPKRCHSCEEARSIGSL